MKYHYQQGIVEKDRKSHRKVWLALFAVAATVVYASFIFTNLALNGWPLEPIDKTAKLVKNTKPGSEGDRLFIPAINLNSGFGSSLKQSGTPTTSSVTVTGTQLAFNVTPDGLRSVSPFFNIDKLKADDEIFLDSAGTRYVYRITDSPHKDSKKLVLQGQGKKLTSEAIGTIAWHGGKAELQAL